MIQRGQSSLTQTIVHRVGNQAAEESLELSANPLELTEELQEILKTYFLGSFKEDKSFRLSHSSDLALNEIYAYVTKIFEEPKSLAAQSRHMATHLYECSAHPNIKSGELYVAYFDELSVDGEVTEAVGIFKSERKDTFLKVLMDEDNLSVEGQQGVNVQKLDKGCIICNTEKEEGYRVLAVDNTSPSREASFWMDDFLQIKPREDSYYHTQNALELCRNFVSEIYNGDHNVEKADQADMLNRSVDYFKKKETFNIREFEQEVIEEKNVIDAFQEYRQNFQTENRLHAYDEFDISKPAVNKGKAQFKHVLKLDKNFHIYIHGDRDRIEKGFDESRGMHYYKLFFDAERM